MKLSTYNPSLPHACDDASFNTAYRYGLVERWEENDFRVEDFTVFPEGVFTEDGLLMLSQALNDGWNHRNFFYYTRLGVNWFTGPAIDSLIDFVKPEPSRNSEIPERPERPDTPADALKKLQVLNGLGATSVVSPERLSSIWDVGTDLVSVLEGMKLGDNPSLIPDIRFVPPGFELNGSQLPAGIDGLVKSGGMTALPLIQCLKEMEATRFSKTFVAPLIDQDVIGNFGKLLAEHGLFIALWFDKYLWPAIARSVGPNVLVGSEFDDLCSEAYQYRPGDDVKNRFDVLMEHIFWNLVLKSLECPDITRATTDWIDEYYSNRNCLICGNAFNLFRQKGWIYFGSNGEKNICFNCPIVKYPGTNDLPACVRDFVQICGFPPPDGDTPIDIRVTAVLDQETMVDMVKTWSAMGGIGHVKRTYGFSWFESMVHSGALPDGTIVTQRGVKSLADDGCICLSVGERLIDDWLYSRRIAHQREPLYPFHPEYNATGLKRADWLIGDIYVEYFGLQGNRDYDVRTMAKLALARAEGINILPIYPVDMINLDSALGDLARSI